MALQDGPAATASAGSRWEHDMQLMHTGIEKLFMNEFDESEKLFKTGMELDPPRSGTGEYDIRGSFALVNALVAVMRGVATFADDQLKECEERLRQADSLAAQEAQNWAGKKVTRGICTLSIGILQMIEHSYVKGIYNVLKSWTWIRTLKTEAVDFQGKEREVVRSAALFTLGSFYMIIGLLPPTTMKLASWLSGFPGDREEGLRMIRECWVEEGLLSPWAALTLISYNVDTKTFLGEALTPDQVAETKAVIDWASKKFPGSLFFSGLAADFVAVSERDVVRARAIHEQEAPEMSKLPALTWVLNYKRGIYALTEMAWPAAGRAFQTSLGVYVEAGRRSMVPFMAAYALICYSQSEVEGLEVEATRAAAADMLALLEKYKAMPKKDWGRQDKWAFKVLGRYGDGSPGRRGLERLGMRRAKAASKQASSGPWPLADLAVIMAHQVRCTWWMSRDSLGKLHNKIAAEIAARETQGTCSADDRVRLCMATIDILRQKGDVAEAHREHARACALESELSKEGRELGAMGMNDYLAALMSYEAGDLATTKHFLTRVKRRGTKYDLYQLIMLKMVALSRSVGVDLDQEYETLDIPAGKSVTLEVAVGGADGGAFPFVKWFWLVAKHTINFRVQFLPASGAKAVTIQEASGKEAAEEAATGELLIEEHGAGKLQLTWDNSFSMLRGKTVKYRLSPPGLNVAFLNSS